LYCSISDMAKSPKPSERITKLHAALSQKSFGIKDIKYFDANGTRPLHYWLSEGIVRGLSDAETNSNASNWRKFSFYEFIWVLVVRSLKGLNYDNALLKKNVEAVFKKMAEDYRMLEFEKAVITALAIRNQHIWAFFGERGEFDVKYDADGVIDMFLGQHDILYTHANINRFVREFLGVKEFFPYIKENELLEERELQALEVLYNNPKAEVGIRVEGKDEIVIKPGKEAPQKFISTIMSEKCSGISIRL